MKLVFCGTPQFAVPTLNALLQRGHQIPLVISQPDRPSGRGQVLTNSPVKQRALEQALPLAQPVKLKNNSALQSQLEQLNPDAIVVVAYGRLIPAWMLNLPRLGAFNVHASLLPKYRGAAPIQWAIARGENSTGVTIMRLDEGLDTGPILLQSQIPIHSDETAVALSPRLAELGATLMVEALEQLDAGRIRPKAQDPSLATFAPLLTKQDGQIDFSQTAFEIYNRFRGFQPWPGLYTAFRGKQLQVTAARVGRATSVIAPSTIGVQTDQLFFCCAAGSALEVLEVHPEGKKRMSAREFLSGYRPQNNEVLGTGRSE